jgi:uncharacterized protein (TIRG00374 family)
MAKKNPGFILWINLGLWSLAILLLWWTLREISFGQVLQILQRLTFLQIITLLFLNALIAFALGVRWWIILRAQGYEIAYPIIAAYRIAGFSISYFTPGPHLGGEPLQVAILARNHGVPVPAGAASVAIDKLLDMLANFTFLVIGLGITIQTVANFPVPPSQLIVVTAPLLLCPAAMLGAYWRGFHPISIAFNWIVNRPLPGSLLDRIGHNIKASEDMAGEFCQQRPFAMAQAAGFSLIIWGLLLLEFGMAVYFLSGETVLTRVINLMTAMRLAILLPSPGGLGTVEASQVLMSRALGLSPAIGLGLSALIRVRDITLGLIGLWWGGRAAGGWHTLWTRQETS